MVEMAAVEHGRQAGGEIAVADLEQVQAGAGAEPNDGAVEVFGHRERRPDILIAVHQQRRHVDPRQVPTQILCRRPGDGTEAGRMEGPHAGGEPIDVVGCRHRREHRRQERVDELVGRQRRQRQRLGQSLIDDVRRQGSGPPGVPRDHDERTRQAGVSCGDGEGERTAE